MFFWITGHQHTTSDLTGILDSVNTCWWNRLGYSSWNTHQGLHIGHCISTCSFSYSIYPFFLHRLQLERTIRSPRPTMHPQIAMHKSLVCSIDTVFFSWPTDWQTFDVHTMLYYSFTHWHSRGSLTIISSKADICIPYQGNLLPCWMPFKLRHTYLRPTRVSLPCSTHED